VTRSRTVFLNVPFDSRYKKLLDALVYTVAACGLRPSCALEADDASTLRLDKIYALIHAADFGIHDLSRTSLDSHSRLPRFNMPLELGIFLGAKRFGSGPDARKVCLILDRDQYRYQQFCSDIAGQDIRAHNNTVDSAIRAVRNWLQANLRSKAPLPGASTLADSYVQFRRDLPRMCAISELRVRELTFLDYRALVQGWLDVDPGRSSQRQSATR